MHSQSVVHITLYHARMLNPTLVVIYQATLHSYTRMRSHCAELTYHVTCKATQSDLLLMLSQKTMVHSHSATKSCASCMTIVKTHLSASSQGDLHLLLQSRHALAFWVLPGTGERCHQLLLPSFFSSLQK